MIYTFPAEPLVSGKTILTVGAGAAAAVTAPYVLPFLGFGTAGVTAGSWAASLQVSILPQSCFCLKGQYITAVLFLSKR